MSAETHISETVSAAQLRAFIERIERVEEEIKTLNGDKSDIYKELRACGFDVKAVRQCVAARKLDSAEREERTAIFEMYWNALTGASRTYTREARVSTSETKLDLPPHDAETGEIKDEPETAAEVAGDYLREPVAAEQGQIIREGDAPRETGHQDDDDDRWAGGDASCPDTEHQSEQPCTATGPSEEAGATSDKNPAIILPDPHLPTAADGQRGIQSSAADGAKSEAASPPSPVGSAQAGRHYVKAEQAVTLSPSSEASSSPLTTKAGDVPLSSPATHFDNPRCKHPDTCHLAHSEDSCLDCVLTWAKLPKDEQVQRWADAHGAVA